MGVEPTKSGFADHRRTIQRRRHFSEISSPGIEPGLRPSQGRVLSGTLRGFIGEVVSRQLFFLLPTVNFLNSPPRIRTSSNSFEDCRASLTLAGYKSDVNDFSLP